MQWEYREYNAQNVLETKGTRNIQGKILEFDILFSNINYFMGWGQK